MGLKKSIKRCAVCDVLPMFVADLSQSYQIRITDDSRQLDDLALSITYPHHIVDRLHHENG